MTGSGDFTPEEWDAIQEGADQRRHDRFHLPARWQLPRGLRDGEDLRRCAPGASRLRSARRARRRQAGDGQGRSALTAGAEEHGLQRIREAVSFLEQNATPEELAEYRGFVLSLAQRVAGAKGEGSEVSEAESAAIAEISQALGT